MQEIKKMIPKVPQFYLDFINQLFEIEKKISNLKEENSIQRNVNKMKVLIEEEFFNSPPSIGLSYYNPSGEAYTDTRTDCEATISGTSVENLEITEVIKPIIYYSYQESNKVIKVIVQPAVVIVQSKKL
jgi:hypothetical protein